MDTNQELFDANCKIITAQANLTMAILKLRRLGRDEEVRQLREAKNIIRKIEFPELENE